MKVTIVSPERTIYAGNADGIVLPGKNGRFEVLENHAPIISVLTPGKIICKNGAETVEVAIKDGFVEVARNQVSVCAEEEKAGTEADEQQ